MEATSSINQALKNLSNTGGVESGIRVASSVLSLLTSETLGEPKSVVDSKLIQAPNAERQDHWFKQHPWMRGQRATFELLDSSVVPIQAKFFWLQKKSTSFVAGSVHFTKNWEDYDFTRTEEFKVGVDFFLLPDSSAVLVVLSNYGKLRVLELHDRLTNTQIEIFRKWHAFKDFGERAALHEAVWTSLRLQSVNSSFYDGVSDAFHDLVGHLMREGRDEDESKLFASRLIGRLIFVWFLRKMGMISTHESYFNVNSNDQDSFYRDRMEKLFFQILNVPPESRSAKGSDSLDMFTPYLNGGLFEPQSSDRVGDVKNSFPPAFFQSLFEHFEKYNFTTDESTPDYEQVAIDPEMLGRVFESLLATQVDQTGTQARKASGAFYTPREIVSYMCREAIRRYLKREFQGEARATVAADSLIDTEDREWAISPSNSLRDKVGDYRTSFIQALVNIRAIDPASGSGAFPMGMLAELLRLLERLEPSSKRRQLKLQILENCIFGVDIEPMAVEISRLRAWLSIIVESNPKDKVEQLPNLDFRFVCANALIPLMDKNGNTGLFDDAGSEEKLASIRHQYFSATDLEFKTELKHEYKGLVTLDQDSADGPRSRQVKSFDPFDHENSADFFDPETMFGNADHFDVVIGNPPYISALTAKRTINAKLRESYKQTYKCAVGAYDVYILFMEKGLQLAGENGLVIFITPTKFLSAKYAEAFRGYSSEYLAKIANFSNQKIFDSAGVSTLVSIFQKGVSPANVEAETFSGSFEAGSITTSFSRGSLGVFPENLWGHLTWGDFGIVSEIYSNSVELSHLATVVSSTTASEADEYSASISPIYAEKSFKKVNTGNISPYTGLWGIREYSNKRERILTPYLPSKSVNARRNAMYKSSKIIISKLSKRLVAMIDIEGHYASSNTVFVLEPRSPYSLEVIAAILNSNLMHYVYKTVFSGLNMLGSFQFQAPQIRLLPMPLQPDHGLLNDIVSEVNRIVGARNDEGQLDASLARVNDLVYELYRLDAASVREIEAALEFREESVG